MPIELPEDLRARVDAARLAAKAGDWNEVDAVKASLVHEQDRTAESSPRFMEIEEALTQCDKVNVDDDPTTGMNAVDVNALTTQKPTEKFRCESCGLFEESPIHSFDHLEGYHAFRPGAS